MKSLKTALAVLVLFAAGDLIASGPVGIYAMVDKVVFEPNDTAPERIQIWGAFALVDGGVSRASDFRHRRKREARRLQRP